jgi:hypothetical protein
MMVDVNIDFIAEYLPWALMWISGFFFGYGYDEEKNRIKKLFGNSENQTCQCDCKREQPRPVLQVKPDKVTK